MSLAVRITRPCRARGEILERGAVVAEGHLGIDREDLANIVHAGRGEWAKAPEDAPTLKDDPEPIDTPEKDEPPAQDDPKPKKRRGRPRKNPEPDTD